MPRGLHRNRIVCFTALALLGPPAGCGAPAALAPVAQEHRAALRRLAEAYALDLALLDAQIEALLEVRRTALLGRLHRELIERGYITPLLTPDPDAFARDLADPAAGSALVAEVRLGRITPERAAAFLDDYALAMRMASGDALRAEMLGRLAPLSGHDEAAGALRAGLREHARDVAQALADLDADSAVLERYAAVRPATERVLSESAALLWRSLLLPRIEDPAEREAVERLLEELFGRPIADTSAL